jgi:hypothetical protein
VIAWTSKIFYEVALILINPPTDWISSQELVFSIFIGILIAIAASLVALAVHVKYRSFFKRKKGIEEEFKQG